MATNFFRISEQSSPSNPSGFAIVIFAVMAAVTFFLFTPAPFWGILALVVEYYMCSLLLNKPVRLVFGTILGHSRPPRVAYVPEPTDRLWQEMNVGHLQSLNLRVFRGTGMPEDVTPVEAAGGLQESYPHENLTVYYD